ncbi:protein of unknown function [Devosia lucknowensis]|uniref:DUF4180 domain-containing protein n=1 Tax=Devosia lucknowensis TaxID=1096929 RepID=A0A1Y6EB91_9HYPH|nr:DUF4180 domain-containing protein [Devosia lucknowensis]SMQ59834.1 protein of unknown function [Devosia lucknowensis]
MSTRSFNDTTVFFVEGEGPALASEQDALDLIGATYGTGADMIAVSATRFAPGFFDLSTRQAGHFFQKLQNYQMRLAIIGDISAHMTASKALRDFVGETNRIGHHLFVTDEAALETALRPKD